MKERKQPEPQPITGDEILRRMLNTPPQPHEPKPAVKKPLRTTPRKGD